MILGVCQRSGTNYLARLLQCHEDCDAPALPVAEDFLLVRAHRLTRYTSEASRYWWRWGERGRARAELELGLGRGLISFLESRVSTTHVVSKTPEVTNLRLYPRFFADARLIILVRDGRAVTESLVRGLGLPYEKAVRRWRRGAREILEFDAGAASNASFIVVRYESLVEELDAELSRILEFCGLDAAGFDHHAARTLPVLGSSFEGGDGTSLMWEPVERPPDFGSTPRFATWNRWKHARFNWLAEREQIALGYETTTLASGQLRLTNLALDALWPLRNGPSEAIKRGRVVASRAHRRVAD